jgi:WD40-like Beta Propeller Repeat
MTTPDVTTLLAEALHREATTMTVTDSHQAVHRLERAVRSHRRRRVVLSLAAAAVAVGVLVAGAAVLDDEDRASGPPADNRSGSMPPPGHRILFDSDAKLKILLVSDRGGRPVPVMDGLRPRFSPDGRRVAFVDPEGMPAVATVGEWRGRPLLEEPLAAGRQVTGMVWSPDGTRIAYVEQLDGDISDGGDLHVVDVATGSAELVTTFRAPFITVLDWSPDGSSLVLGFDRSGEGGRMVVDLFDLSTRELTPLLRGWGETVSVRYSPNGSQIAFYSDSRQCICVAAPDGTDVREVLKFSGAEPDSARLAWSPDGTRLVWDERFGGHINLLDVSSGISTELATGGGRAPAIDWDRP